MSGSNRTVPHRRVTGTGVSHRSAALLLLASVALLLCGAGCVTGTVATAGALADAATVADIAATAVSTGSEVYALGKLDSVDLARYDQWLIAVRAGADDLRLHVKRDRARNEAHDDWTFVLTDDRGHGIDVDVQRRTEMLVATRIDVGLFGSEPAARLLLARVRHHLPVSARDPTTMHAASPPLPLGQRPAD